MIPNPDIPEAFAGPVSDRLQHLVHYGPVPETDATVISAEADGMRLSLVLDGENETVADARFTAPADAPEAAILDLLCAHAIGAPVREVIEHGLIFALQALRAPEAPSPVAGILTPRNAGACFKTPLRLIAAIRRETEARFGRHKDTNFFDRPYSETWSKLDKIGKRDLVLPHIDGFKAANGISDDAFELVEIDQYDRLFLVFTDEIPVWDKPVLLMKLERWLRKQTGERIELFTEVVKDANRIRRL
ncbi:hypothetical protein [Nisaea denitrificans]|uniref:hypothetical protein n=1 Tax=Nisaea denitrificans TaxID=390877 RepID=UPI000426BE28|nr:hypothetical protein [Nisaea denitrificans]